MIGFADWRVAEVNVPYGKAKRTHCRHGHEYTPENTYWSERPDGARWRQCRTCGRERSSFRSRLYGLTLEAYQDLFTRQGGLCAICGAPPSKRALAVTTTTRPAKLGRCFAPAATSGSAASATIRNCSPRRSFISEASNGARRSR